MKLTGRVLATAVVPFALAIGVTLVLFQQHIAVQRESLLREDARTGDLIRERLSGEREALAVAGSILGSSRETARAVETREIRFLQTWGELFLSSAVSLVLFTDADGTVLYRSTDPFRFADSVADTEPFASIRAGKTIAGIYEMEGDLYLAYGQPVYRYGEIEVGTVVTAVLLDEAFLDRLVLDTGASVVLVAGVVERSSSPVDRPLRRVTRFDLPVSSGGRSAHLMVRFYRSTAIDALATLQIRLIVLVVVLLLGIAASLAWTIHRYLVPYSFLVDELLQIVRGSIPTESAPDHIRTVFHDPNHEVTVIAHTVAEYIATISANVEELERLSTTDQLTGLYNRRHMERVLAEEFERAVRYEEMGAILIADIDHFKQINDTFGHPEGDRVLRETAALLAATTRQSDVVARWGGEEFLLLLPHIDGDGAAATAEKIRAAVEAAAIVADDGRLATRPVGTVSIGVATYHHGETRDAVIRRADARLYRAKTNGRNRIVAAD